MNPMAAIEVDDMRRALAMNEKRSERIGTLEKHLRVLGAYIEGGANAVAPAAIDEALDECDRLLEVDP